MSAPAVPLAEVEWRVDGKPSTKDGQTSCRFVPYLDALWVSQALDEWLGHACWSDEYEVVTIGGKDAVLCRIGVCVGEGQWVTRTDIGVPSNFEGQKGAVTDAFKRCASRKWGVGRNVYDLPTLWAPCRTFQSNGKDQAAPNKDSLPAIMRELKSRGFTDADGGKVRDVDPDTGEIIIDQPAEAARPASTGERVCMVCQKSLAGAVNPVRGGGGWNHADCVKPGADPSEEPF